MHEIVNYNQLLQPDNQFDLSEWLGVVLVAPRNPLNIGAAARAMANFGVRRLSVVSPYAPSWREARSAVGAPELLAEARETATLAEAVADCTLVVGTGSLVFRKPEQPVVRLPELAPLVWRELGRGGRIALVFGSEKHGLSREYLAFCHRLVEIPTDARQPSMNLGQAVAVCLYELTVRAIRPVDSKGCPAEMGAEARTSLGRPRSGADVLDDLASCKAKDEALSGAFEALTERSVSSAFSGRLEILAGLVEEAMQASGYSPRSMQAANRHDLRLLLRRLKLSDADTRRILGLFRRILWRLSRMPNSLW